MGLGPGAWSKGPLRTGAKPFERSSKWRARVLGDPECLPDPPTETKFDILANPQHPNLPNTLTPEKRFPKPNF